MKIEIKSTNTGEQTIKPSGKVGAKEFTPFTKVSQSAYVHGLVDRNGAPEPFPVRISIDLGTIEERQPAFAVGFYDIDSESYFIDRFANLCLGRLSLKAIPSVRAAAAA
jgi:hypothetical protein